MSTIRVQPIQHTEETVARDSESAQRTVRQAGASAFAVSPADLLLALCALAALMLTLGRGEQQSSTSIAILLAALAARFAGLSAVLVIVPLVLLPVHWLVRPTINWLWLAWDAL